MFGDIKQADFIECTYPDGNRTSSFKWKLDKIDRLMIRHLDTLLQWNICQPAFDILVYHYRGFFEKQ